MRSVLVTSMSLAAFVFLITATNAAVRADEKAAEPVQTVADGEQGVLLLRDSGVLAGVITRAADWYVVERNGGHMQIAKSRVQLACRTLEEAYECRRRELKKDNAADHLRLAEWCIRYELRDAAKHELDESRRLDPDLPRLALLERRLEKGMAKPAVKEKESIYLAGVKAANAPTTNALATSAAPAATASATDLPPGVVELFTRKVQPVLVNNCTTSGCHHLGGKESFQLDRAILRGESNRRTTMRNLEAVLALVDRAHPDKSLLLTVPRRAHGGASAAVFGPRHEQAFGHLVDWVDLVAPATHSAPSAVASAESRASLPSVEPASHTEDVPAEIGPPARKQFALHASDSASDDSSMTLRSPHRLQVGVQLKSWQPRDEFDPEIFNRAQQARGRQASPAVAPADDSITPPVDDAANP